MDALLNDLCFVVNIDDANNNDVKEIFEIADPFSDDDVEDEDNNIDDEMFGKELFSEHHNASSSTIVYAADGGGSARNILESAAISSPWSSLHIDDDDSAYIHYKTLPIEYKKDLKSTIVSKPDWKLLDKQHRERASIPSSSSRLKTTTGVQQEVSSDLLGGVRKKFSISSDIIKFRKRPSNGIANVDDVFSRRSSKIENTGRKSKRDNFQKVNPDSGKFLISPPYFNILRECNADDRLNNLSPVSWNRKEYSRKKVTDWLTMDSGG